MNCRICDYEMEQIETLYGKERNVTLLYKEPFVAPKIDVALYRCPNCSHMQIEDLLSEDYYLDYSLISPSSDENDSGRYTPSFLQYYQEKFEQLSRYAKTHSRILDIGCGAGVLMDYEKNYFSSVLGVEPSKAQWEIAKRAKRNVINAYFTRDLALEPGFSAFVSTQVFEHITSVRETLEYAWDLLENGGVGLVEIPNGQKMYQEQSYYDVFPDHVNYYTPLSLCTLAKKTGYEVISVAEEFHRNHLSLFVRKPFHEHQTFAYVIDENRRILNQILSSHHSVSVWGVGAKARSFIQHIDDRSKILHYWDVNRLTWGQYLDSAQYPITQPTKEAIGQSDLILIFAAAFTEEIMHDLREQYAYQGDIVRFDGKIRLQNCASGREVELRATE